MIAAIIERMRSGPIYRRPAVLLALALCAVAAVVSLLGRLTGRSEAAWQPVRFPATADAETYPSFSPDGKSLAYSARAGEGEAFHLYLRELSGRAAAVLTSGPASDIAPVWSPDGHTVAFLRVSDEGGLCMTLAAGWAADPRRIAVCAVSGGEEALPALTWTPDGKSLIAAVPATNGAPALAVLPLDGSAPKPLTAPPADGTGDFTPAVSPDGKRLAFIRTFGPQKSDIFVCSLSGENPGRRTFDGNAIRGFAWTQDGRDLIYAGQRVGRWGLWRVSAGGGTPREVRISGGAAEYPAIGRTGGLAYSENSSSPAIWRAEVVESGGRSSALIASSAAESAPAYSADGKSIAWVSTLSGAEEIWVGDASGGGRRQITKLAGAMRPQRIGWSPDGGRILFESSTNGETALEVVPVSGGSPKRVATGASDASWSRDGKSIYYQSAAQIFKVGADGTNARPLTDARRRSANTPEESVDGRFVYFWGWGGVNRMPAEGGMEERVFTLDENSRWGGMYVTARGIYYLAANRARRGTAGYFYDFAAGTSSRVLQLPGVEPSGVSFSPDARFVVYSRVDRSRQALAWIRNFE